MERRTFQTTCTRRAFLKTAAWAAAGAACAPRPGPAAIPEAPPAIRGKPGEARCRPDLLGKDSPPGLEVIQITSEPDVPASHLYMEAQVFLNPRSSWKSEAHIHPFLSPDGRCGFFNSDETGILQAYMIRGLDRL